jgi:hypothetical protein
MTMRPVVYSFTPDDESTTYFATGLTGAGPWDTGDFTLSETADGLAHQLSLTSAANLSGITITVTGTDADGRSISEAITGPNANTVESTNYFKSISAISAGATLGANTMDVGIVDEFASQTIPLEVYLTSQPPSAQVVLSGTAGFDIEGTLSDIRASYSPPPAQGDFSWVNDANFTAKSATLVGNLAVSYRAIRLVVNSYSSGAELELAIITPL